MTDPTITLASSTQIAEWRVPGNDPERVRQFLADEPTGMTVTVRYGSGRRMASWRYTLTRLECTEDQVLAALDRAMERARECARTVGIIA